MKRPLCESSLALARLLCVLTCAWATAASLAQGPPEDANFAASETGRKIIQLAQAYESAGFRGAVLAARDGQVVAAVGVGHADLKGEQPIVPSTLFEIASITKPFTAVEAMRLAADGKLDLDASISDYLPGVPDECKPITVRHLLQHTSGIPGTNSQGSGDDLAAVLPVFLKGGPQREPGTHWEYWNQGYALLSAIIARVSGESCVDYCRRAVFEPAGMAHSCFTGDAPPPGVNVAVGTSGYGEPRSALEHPYGSYGYQYRGMGGLVTNVWDLWRWDRALAGETLLSEASKTEMFTPGERSYGLGWFVLTNKAGRLMQSHSGGVRGFACDLRRFPEHEALVVVLSARDDVPVWRIAEAVEATLFGDREVLLPPAPLESQIASEIAGRYEDERGNVLTVERQDAVTRATVKWQSGPTTRAILGSDDQGGLVFYEWMSAIGMEIVRDEAGSVTALAIQGHAYQRSAEGAGAGGDDGLQSRIAKASELKLLDETLAKELLGRYDDGKGVALVVGAVEGGHTSADIHWSQSGPVSYGRFKIDDSGALKFVDTASMDSYSVEVGRGEDGAVESIAILIGTHRKQFWRPGADGKVTAPAQQPEASDNVDQWRDELVGRYDDGDNLTLTITKGSRQLLGLFEFKSRPGLTMHAKLDKNEEGGIVLYYGGGPLDVAIDRDENGAVAVLRFSGEQPLPHPFRRLAAGEEPQAQPATPPPAAEPPDWAALLLGRYKDEQAIELVVATSGRMVTAQIHWSPKGPITYARLEHTEAGEFEFVEFSRSPSKHPVEIIRDDAGKAQSITIIAGERRQKFDRVEEK